MLVLIGPSASGKTELAKYLVSNYNFKKVITYTTRKKRVNEKDGIDYHFIDETTFLSLKNNNFFAETTSYNNNFYGTSLSSLIGDKVIILDPNGLDNLNKISIIKKKSFYLNVSSKTRFERMIKRNDNKTEALQRINIDDEVFDLKKINADYIIEANNLKIDELATIILKKYQED